MPIFDFGSFLQPPPDLPIEYAFDFQLQHNPSCPILIHNESEGELKYYRYSEVIPAIHRAGLSISTSIGFTVSPDEAKSPPLVAILAETSILSSPLSSIFANSCIAV